MIAAVLHADRPPQNAYLAKYLQILLTYKENNASIFVQRAFHPKTQIVLIAMMDVQLVLDRNQINV